MNKDLFKKAAGMLSALTMTASSVLPAAVQAAETVNPRHEYDDVVHVIVELYGDPVLAADTGDMGSDYLDTAAAQARSQQLKNLRHNAFGEILSVYPDAELDFTYDSVFNGFSCTLPMELLDEAEALAAVKNITVSEKNHVPELNYSRQATGTNYFSSETGLTGEGKVIAVIDTELCTDHEMFAPLDDSVSVKLTKKDIAAAVKKRDLNFNIDPNAAYISSKIPYAVSLVNEDQRYSVADDDFFMYHGTHVCGIAAGNRVKPSEYDTEISGVAPDAQLIFMAGFDHCEGSTPTISDHTAVAGIEDAVKLGADVVNLSFGTSHMDEEQDDLYSKVIKNADNAGVVICAAAGNEGWPEQTAENVDRSTINSPGSLDKIFSVAAASISSYDSNVIKLADGTKLFCSIVTQQTVDKDTEYEYVYCGTGSSEEFSAADISGKVALVDKIEYDADLAKIAEAAHKAGAAGIMLCSEEDYYYAPEYEKEDFFIISTDITGTELVRAQKDHRIFFRTDITEITSSDDMAYFTSHGCRQDLELKPEISAPGEGIYSAAYSGYEYLDGTSMASPFTAGCCALTEQYIESKGWKVSGSEKVSLVKKLLMNTADPVCLSDIPYSPRIQGAGLVNMEDVSGCTVTMTNNGKASVCLGDLVGDAFCFDVTLHNYGSSDVVFKNSDLEMIRETTEPNDLLGVNAISDIPESLGASAVFSADPVSVPAGGETTLTVTVTINADDAASLNSEFTNGWFAEGYLTLSGAENCSDISVPILGFHGDWNAPPVIGKDYAADNTLLAESVLRTHFYSCYIPATVSISKALSAFMDRSADDYYPDADPAPRHGYVISQNASKYADLIHYSIIPQRNGHITNINMTDENGREVYSSNSVYDCFTGENQTLYIDPLDVLKNGRYSLNITTELLKPGSRNKPKVNTIQLTIDNDPPLLSNIKIKKENGRKILTVTAKDPELEGFYIVGTGKGCEKGSSDNSGCPIVYLKTICQNLDPYGYFGLDPFGGAVGSLSSNTPSSTLIDDFFSDALNLPDTDLGFFDAVPAEPDENGCMTLEYDVTDLTDYTLSVADRGYNFSSYSPSLPLISNIPGIMEVKTNTPVNGLTPPTYTFKGKVTSEGWEYFNYYADEWIAFEKNKKIGKDLHNERIRYAVHVGDEVAYSNTAIISISDIARISVSLYENDKLIFSDTTLPVYMYDLLWGFFDGHSNYRLVMEADGYVTRVLKFNGKHVPFNIDIYVYRLGDTNGDDLINVTDIIRTAAHIKGKRNFDEYEQKVADVNGDGTVNVSDIVKMAAKIKGKKAFN